jgi:hypothetical protein
VSKIERTVLKDPRIKSVVDPISVILLIRVHAVLSGRSFVASQTTATLEHRVIGVDNERKYAPKMLESDIRLLCSASRLWKKAQL